VSEKKTMQTLNSSSSSVDDDKLYKSFIYSLKSEVTKEKYLKNLKYYMKFLGVTTLRELVNKPQKLRHLLPNGEQALTSFGQIIAHDVHGNRKIFTSDSPEKWSKPIFNTVKEYSVKHKQIVAYSDGPSGSEEIYEMPFNAENVDKLYSETYDPNTTSIHFKPNSRSNKRVTLLIQDHRNNGGMVKEVFYNSIEESLKIFKEHEFNSLWHSFYLPKAIREQIAMDAAGVIDVDKQQTNSSTTNTANPNISNTSAYK
jgi:hypothetical protein